MGFRRKSRELVIQTIYALTYSEVNQDFQNLGYINQFREILDDLVLENEIPKDSNIYKLAEGILEKIIPKLEFLDEIINRHIQKYDREKVGIIEMNILRLAVYEMTYEKVPPPVMIDEAVELGKKYCAEKSPSMINAILDLYKETDLTNNLKKI